MSVTLADRDAAETGPRACQYELEFVKLDVYRYGSVLCMQPSVAIIDRRERGRIALCQADLERMRSEIDRDGFAVANIAVLAEARL